MCLPAAAFGRASVASRHRPTGLSGGKGFDLTRGPRGSCGLPAQLAPTWKRYGLGSEELEADAEGEKNRACLRSRLHFEDVRVDVRASGCLATKDKGIDTGTSVQKEGRGLFRSWR